MPTSRRIMDQVAIVGVGASPYSRDSGRSMLSLALEASRNAILDAGIEKTMVDGLCAYGLSPMETHGAGFGSVQGALGIPEINYVQNSWIGSCLVYAAQAVFSGTTDYCLVVQADARSTYMSRSAVNDPFRASAGEFRPRKDYGVYAEGWMHSGEAYPAFLRRYFHDYGVTRETTGLIAINNRQWASKNPAAVKREPLSMDDYLESRPIWEPFSVLDMDIPVDAAEAIVLTTAEKAQDLPHRPVYINALGLGGARVGEYYENAIAWDQTSPWVANKGLWSRSDLTPADVDLFYPYDGYTANALAHTEAAGFCSVGEAKDLFADSWDKEQNILRLNGGRTMVSTNGGGLSHGRLSGFNFYTEAAKQLRGTVEPERQVPDAKVAMTSIGSFFHDPASMLLHVH